MEVSKQIIEVLDAVGKKFGLAIDWTSQNVVPYIQQLGEKVVNYEFWTSLVWLILAVIGMLIVYIIVKTCLKGREECEYSSDETFYEFIIMIAVVIGCIFFIVAGTQVFDMVACKVFPEKVIVEYVQSLMNSK